MPRVIDELEHPSKLIDLAKEIVDEAPESGIPQDQMQSLSNMLEEAWLDLERIKSKWGWLVK